MPDWKTLVQERLQPLGLGAPTELDLTVEIAQHLEDYYRELLSGGTGEEEGVPAHSLGAGRRLRAARGD